VHVTKVPLSLKQGNYIVDRHQNDCFSPKGTARTRWLYSCNPDLSYSVDSEKTEGKLDFVTVRITKADINVSLLVTVLQAYSGPLHSHENGHLEICQRIYNNAESIAEHSCALVIGKSFSASGETRAKAIENALSMARDEVCIDYSEKTSHIADLVSGKYDELTGRGRNDTDPAQAVGEAFKQVEAERPGKKY
jgi:hypothetical protein